MPLQTGFKLLRQNWKLKLSPFNRAKFRGIRAHRNSNQKLFNSRTSRRNNNNRKQSISKINQNWTSNNLNNLRAWTLQHNQNPQKNQINKETYSKKRPRSLSKLKCKLQLPKLLTPHLRKLVHNFPSTPGELCSKLCTVVESLRSQVTSVNSLHPLS